MYQEAFKQRVLSEAWMHSMFTNSRHARLHHPPRGIQIACAQSSPDIVHQFSPCRNPPSTKRHSSSGCSENLGCIPCSPILAMHESSIHQEAFKYLVLSATRTHSLFTNPRHARIHHPPRGIQAARAQRSQDALLVHQFSPCAGPPSTKSHSSNLPSAQTSILAMQDSNIHQEAFQ